MTHTVYTADAELRHPLRFLGWAFDDLRRSPAIAWGLFRSNLTARYRRAWLGYLWLLLPTLGTTLLWVYVQSRRLVEITPTALPYPIYVLAGTILWQVFAESLNAPLQQLAAGRQLITRSRVPHEALILAGVYEVLLNCLVRLAVLAVVLIWFGVASGPALLLVPVGILALTLFGLTLGLFVAPLGMLYDDVSRAITLITGFWFFLTPVLYRAPASGFLRFNPVTPLLESTRAWLTDGHAGAGFLTVTSVTTVVLLLAWLFHRLARPHLVARLG
jgi:lipopolysaccharide transport system permease protein